MIYNLIGSGILVAVGAGLGGICVALWRVQAYDQARRDYQRQCASLRSESASADKWARRSGDLLADRLERDATIARLSDTVGQLQYKRDKTLEYCKQFRVRGAVVAGILSGERGQ